MFSNLTPAQEVSAQLLSRFGKNTNILMDIQSHRVNVRRAHDGALIARFYVTQPVTDEYIYTMIEPDQFIFTSIESLTWQIMASSKFPQIVYRERSWSKPSYKEVEAY